MKNYQKAEQRKRDETALSYEEWFRANKGALFDLRERELFVQVLRKNNLQSALDIGSGTGRITEAISPLVERIVAGDLSLQSLRVLKSKQVPNCSPICLNASFGLPFQDNTFDLVVSCQVLPLL